MGAVRSLVRAVSRQGLRLTPQRICLLEVLAGGGDLTAEEIVARLRKTQPHISLATVYRNLNTFVALGIISKYYSPDGVAHYRASARHEHLFICLGCGDAQHLATCPLQAGLLDEELSGRGLQVVDHRFEIRGYCRRCQKEGAK
ncbi:MAG: Fur family transcriptional regulator [Bacillota bacterium]